MRLPFLFAFRYLFSRKSVHLVNVVVLVSTLAVAAVAMALVVTLSIFNGYRDLILAQTASIDPDLLVQRIDGHAFDTSTDTLRRLSALPGVTGTTAMLSEMALVRVAGRETVAEIVGVDEHYPEAVNIHGKVVAGRFSLSVDSDSLAATYNVGRALAAELDIIPGYSSAIEIFVPRRLGIINPLAPASAFSSAYGYPASVFDCGQEQADRRIILPAEDMYRLSSYNFPAASGLAVTLKAGSSVKEVQHAVRRLLGSDYYVLDKEEQHPDIARLVAMEKWMTFLILVFILLLSLFNVVSSLSMIILEKRDDIRILFALGANNRLISNIFIVEGGLITIAGAGLGILSGLGLCLLQQHFGFIRTQADFFVDPYPVRIIPTDLLIVSAVVIGLGILSSVYPVRYYFNRRSGCLSGTS